MNDHSPLSAPAANRLRSLVLAFAVLLLILHAQRFGFVNDDAFISFRYARNWVEAGALVFNPGERVEGYTNFLWTAAIALALRCGLDPVPFSHWAGVVAGALTLLLVARTSARLSRAKSAWDAAGPVLLAIAPSFACWSSGGLETQLFTLLVTLGWGRALIDLQLGSRISVSCGVWFGLATLARPEGVLLFAAILAARGLEGLRTRYGLTTRSEGPAGRLAACCEWRALLGFAVLFVPFLIGRRCYYGWWLPNTFYVKGESVHWPAGLAYLWSFAKQNLVYLFGPAALLAPRAVRGRLLSVGAALCVVLGLHVARVGGDFMALHRFLVPLLPWFALAASLTLAEARLRWQGHARFRRSWVVLSAVGVVALAAGAYQVGSAALRVDHDLATRIDSIGLVKLYADRWSRVGRWLRDTFPPDTSIAVDAAGAIPYYSRLPTLDALGLCDEWIAHHVAPEGGRPGHEKHAPPDYILRRKIDLLIFHPALGAQPPPPRDRGEGWARSGYRWRVERISEDPTLYFGFWQCERGK